MNFDLIIARHGESSLESPSQSDFDRPLNSRGLQEVAQMGKVLKAKGYLPSQILCSRAKRTSETYHWLVQNWNEENYRVEFLDELYLANKETHIEVLKQYTDKAPLMLIAHNPGVTDLVNMLAGGQLVDNLPTCGICILKYIDQTMSFGSAKLVEFLGPKDLIEM